MIAAADGHTAGALDLSQGMVAQNPLDGVTIGQERDCTTNVSGQTVYATGFAAAIRGNRRSTVTEPAMPTACSDG